MPVCVQVHIRRGDKWKEADPIRDSAYSLAAQALYNNSASFCSPPACLENSIFISTEDESAIDYFVNHTSWAVHYVAYEGGFKTNTTDTVTIARNIGPSRDMLGSLLNLELALECGAWVGTLSSNWCRLIDQLRSTVACKAELPFLDPAQPRQHDYDFWH